jgi:hypothetical protein
VKILFIILKNGEDGLGKCEVFPLFENELVFWDDSKRKRNLLFMEGWNTSTHSI